MSSSDSNRSKLVSMRLIAEKLGVSKATVSLALRGRSNVSEKTRAQILKLANELGYRPDPAIAAIASHRWGHPSPDTHRVLAYISNAKHDKAHAFQMEYFTPAAERAKELGFNLEIFFADKYPDAASISRVLYHRGIRGLLIPPVLDPCTERIINLEWDKFTAVCCAIGTAHPPLHTATFDIFKDTQIAWEKVHNRGFKRVGAAISCHHPITEDDYHRIGASYAMQHILYGNMQKQIPFLLTDINDDASLLEWYFKYRPEIVIGFNHATGEKLIKGGVRIPEDVHFVTLRSKVPFFTGCVPQWDLAAHAAIDLLASEIRDNQWGLPKLPRNILIKSKWQEGQSFGYPKP